MKMHIATSRAFAAHFGPGLRIVAMHPEGGLHQPCTSLEHAAQLNQTGLNIYFTANPATDAGVQGLVCLRHPGLDVDPKPGLDLAATAKRMVEDGLTVWETGRGFSAMLKLSEDVSVKDYQVLQNINRGLVAHYGGDAQVNSPAHLLKLPGSYAWASAKKQAEGYTHRETQWLHIQTAPVDYASLCNHFATSGLALSDITRRDEPDPRLVHQIAMQKGKVTDANDMSAIMAQIIKDMADYTTDESVAKAAIHATPYAQQGRATSRGESRAAKIDRTWTIEWIKAVMATEPTRRMRLHGAKVWAACTHIDGQPRRFGQYNDDTEPAPAPNKAGLSPTLKDKVDVAVKQSPPGLLGDLTSYLYSTAMHPVWEVAFASAVTFLSGITGRCFRTHNDAHLGMYIALVLPSGMGKSGGTTGWGLIQKELAKQGVMPEVFNGFKGPSTIVSAAGFHKALEEQPSAYWVLRDADSLIAAMGKRNQGNERFATLLTAMLDVYGTRSHEVVGTTRRSSKDDSTTGVTGPNVALLLDTQPDSFMAALDRKLVTKGLVSRMLTVRYDGHKPYARKAAPPAPPEELVRKLRELLIMCAKGNVEHRSFPVPLEPAAYQHVSVLNDKYTDMYNKDKEASAPWVRAGLKIEQLGTLIAVCRNPHRPVTTVADLDYARTVVEEDAAFMYRQIAGGGIGQGTDVRSARVLEKMRHYVALTAAQRQATYRVPKILCDYKYLVPTKYLVRLLGNSSDFGDDRNTGLSNLNRELDSLVRGGELRRVSPEVVTEYAKLANPGHVLRRPIENDFYQLTDWSPDFTAEE